MEAPKCYKCGKSHWTTQPCAKTQQDKVSTVLKQSMKPAKDIKRPSKAKFDRNTYQRELMRKRRAK